MKKATHQQTKEHNRNLVLKTIFDHEAISRAEIARLTQLTRATVSDLVNELLIEGLVEEVGLGSSMGGKSPILLSLRPASRYLIGLNLAQDKFIGAIVNLRGEIKETIEYPVQGEDGEQSLELVIRLLENLLATPWKPVVGIGVGTPGLISTRDGVILQAVNLAWKNLPLAHLIRERFSLPVSVLNDSQATAIGEFVYGGHLSEGNMVVVNVRHGVGAGILINGRLFQGDGSGAGEIGHVVVEENGLLCRCGKHGCLETLTSTSAVVRQAGLPGLDQVEAAFRAGDPRIGKIIQDAGTHLGSALAYLVGILNIHEIVLTGEMTRFGEPWLNAVQQAMQRSAFHLLARNTHLRIGSLDYQACILGASSFMLLDGYSLLFLNER
ncbi:transcriptional regulator, MarR family [Anaerolinea thermolimosa]|uniref:ROK family transcriptional regulator n=1 Tax=Anaerolinea thermolimosa TaxID=229919 RepID=UPI000782A90A|nr:ROK family transcriptional regulator [Anaerolinea thermolimosa]GAP07804.1 transcriptional regulator, MarR family [Anaerolinea thermolimosa]